MDLKNLLFIGLGGTIGVLSRYVLEDCLKKVTTTPLPIFFINALGCFIAGIVYCILQKNNASSVIYGFVVVGILGGFTTFSSYTLDILKTSQQGVDASKLLLYVFITPALGLALCFTGYFLTRMIIQK